MGSFCGAVLGWRFLRLLGGQKLTPQKTDPQKPPLCKNFDRFTGPHNFSVEEESQFNHGQIQKPAAKMLPAKILMPLANKIYH